MTMPPGAPSASSTRHRSPATSSASQGLRAVQADLLLHREDAPDGRDAARRVSARRRTRLDGGGEPGLVVGAENGRRRPSG